jgi:hypothetical protein
MYGLGQGVPVDYVLSYMWANLAARVAMGSRLKNEPQSRAAAEVPDLARIVEKQLWQSARNSAPSI